MKIAFLTLSLLASVATNPEAPTQIGDPIGTVTMHSDGSLLMNLLSVGCTDLIAEAQLKVTTDQMNYKDILDHVGGLKPSETKTVLAWPSKPCNSN